MSKIITETYSGKEIRIAFNGEGNPCHLTVRFLSPIDMEVDHGEFRNPVLLSAQLRSELGYSDCCELLFANDIPKDSGLWSLNHDGYPAHL